MKVYLNPGVEQSAEDISSTVTGSLTLINVLRGNQNKSEFSSQILIFQQTFKSCVGCPMADRQAKILFPSNSRVTKTMVHFFSSIFYIGKRKHLPVRRVTSIMSWMVHYPSAILVIIQNLHTKQSLLVDKVFV